jgi:Phage integrase, N-terminal SAM-like domain
MFPEIERFNKWLRCRSPHATTHVHYTSDVKLFFAWVDKPPDAMTLHDVDAYVAYCQGRGQPAATVNRRLAALCRFYRFLDLESNTAPSNPVLPRRRAICQGQVGAGHRHSLLFFDRLMGRTSLTGNSTSGIMSLHLVFRVCFGRGASGGERTCG